MRPPPAAAPSPAPSRFRRRAAGRAALAPAALLPAALLAAATLLPACVTERVTAPGVGPLRPGDPRAALARAAPPAASAAARFRAALQPLASFPHTSSTLPLLAPSLRHAAVQSPARPGAAARRPIDPADLPRYDTLAEGRVSIQPLAPPGAAQPAAVVLAGDLRLGRAALEAGFLVESPSPGARRIGLVPWDAPPGAEPLWLVTEPGENADAVPARDGRVYFVHRAPGQPDFALAFLDPEGALCTISPPDGGSYALPLLSPDQAWLAVLHLAPGPGGAAGIHVFAVADFAAEGAEARPLPRGRHVLQSSAALAAVTVAAGLDPAPPALASPSAPANDPSESGSADTPPSLQAGGVAENAPGPRGSRQTAAHASGILFVDAADRALWMWSENTGFRPLVPGASSGLWVAASDGPALVFAKSGATHISSLISREFGPPTLAPSVRLADRPSVLRPAGDGVAAILVVPGGAADRPAVEAWALRLPAEPPQ